MQALMRSIFARLDATNYILGGGSTGLSVTNAFRASMGGRIRAVVAPSNSTLPLATFDLEPPSTEHFFGGKRKQTAEFSVSIFDKAEVGADVMLGYESSLFLLFDNTELVVSGHDRGFSRSLTRGVPELDGEYLRVDSVFEIVAYSS